MESNFYCLITQIVLLTVIILCCQLLFVALVSFSNTICFWWGIEQVSLDLISKTGTGDASLYSLSCSKASVLLSYAVSLIWSGNGSRLQLYGACILLVVSLDPSSLRNNYLENCLIYVLKEIVKWLNDFSTECSLCRGVFVDLLLFVLLFECHFRSFVALFLFPCVIKAKWQEVSCAIKIWLQASCCIGFCRRYFCIIYLTYGSNKGLIGKSLGLLLNVRRFEFQGGNIIITGYALEFSHHSRWD